MKRWKELGEVPDSDDDGFDDDEDVSQNEIDELALPKPQPQDDATIQDIQDGEEAGDPGMVGESSQKPKEHTDIWSIPSSSPHPSSPFRPTRRVQASQILSQLPSAAPSSSQHKASETLSIPTPRPTSSDNPSRPPEDQAGTPLQPPSSSPDDDIPTPRAPAETTRGSRASSPASLLSRTPTPPPSILLPRPAPNPPRDDPSLSETQLLQEIEALDEQTAVRPQRELRPRKLIQRHPYLIENAKYTTIMKSHGVKPIKVIPDAQPSRRRRKSDDDSQDTEFQIDEDSQEAGGEGLGSLEEESGPLLFDDDEDELGLTPSLPKTSPHGRQLRISSQPTGNDQTDATELSDEEFPPLEALHPVSASRKKQPLKRQRSQGFASTQRKRMRVVPSSSPQGSPQRIALPPPLPHTIWDLSSSPAPQAPEDVAENVENTPKATTRHLPKHHDFGDEDLPAISPVRAGPPSPIVIHEDDAPNDLSENEPGSSSESSGSDSEVVRRHERRIRGVLPASWLRLDLQQKAAPPPLSKPRRRSPSPSPDRIMRKGVALPRQSSPKPPNSTAVPLDLFRDDEESDEDPLPSRQAPPVHEPVRVVSGPVIIDDDDDGSSVIEEDIIDPMLPGRKRAASYTAPSRAKKQRRDGARARVPSWQPKITQVLGRSSKRSSSTRESKKSRVSSSHRPPRAPTPPLLSILDVLEPDAPNFVKIAARSARKSSTLGKTSPSKKLISLATRTDNIDALSVLRDWKAGKTKPKVPAPQRKVAEKPKGRPELREISKNPAPRSRTIQPQKLNVRQTNLDSFVLPDEEEIRQAKPPPRLSIVHPQKPPPKRQVSLQPAQLEEDVGVQKRRRLVRRRTLDAFYSSRQIRNAIGDEPDRVFDVDFTLREPVIEELEERQPQVNGNSIVPGPRQERRATRGKLLKRRPPQQVDVQAPQYARANDPLPVDLSSVEIDVQDTRLDGRNKSHDKLGGLGPYGTHYTHHFDVFPLDRGVFFHETTVIGRGLVQEATDSGLSGRIRHPRPAVSFSLDGRTLRWSGWNDNVSSELGIVVDWVTEQLVSSGAGTVEGATRKVIDAADFVLSYPLRALSVSNDLEEKAFVSRCFEVITSFFSRMESIDWAAAPDVARRTQLEVVIRLVLMLQAARSLNRTTGGDPVMSNQLDVLLGRFAGLVIRRLLDCGTDALRTLYGDMQRAAFRERGIRPDQYLANCWVVMIRLLERAAIPRSSFWDVAQAAMLARVPASEPADVPTHERFWRDMFTLLPLTEIDDLGILIPDMRHSAPTEGWTLPQQLIKRVFALYQENPRQPPGFNDYCRALVARCHFLVQQWGWRKCTGIIGTIFDFFGSQSLSHLRNEEVYKSPRFLEELDSRPSLAIEPEDRCFHIFIKLLALVIQRLRSLGRVNDIRNLVARTLPNHNRQYLKEDTIHQHDLAALRNHHDLLCTLFWVSPPEARPSVHHIEELIVPGSAHKEACLINIRAWGQLARFLVSSGESAAVFRPFAIWRDNVFNQVLEQYQSAASEVEQQFRTLANKMVGITRNMLDEMIAKNKATALDVLHVLVRASLDVMSCAPTLEGVMNALNLGQLQKVFTSLDYHSDRFDWGILRTALDTVEHLMWRIDQASEEHFSSEFADNLDAPALEDAVLSLNEKLCRDFFFMARTLMAMQLDPTSRQYGQHAVCVEKTITLSARIAARLVKSRVTAMPSFFSTSTRHWLFSDLPKNLKSQERKYLPLFFAVLVQNDILDFKNLETSVFGLWMMAIVKPNQLLGYENYLAEALKKKDAPCLDRTSVAAGITPDYDANVAYFASALHHMRCTYRASSGAQARNYREEFSRTLQLVMQKMKEDLGLLRGNAAEHGPYIDFVRQIISLIKSHGVGFCTVDEFFTQPSADYSPPLQDPQLRAASIVSYGVRLGEKDASAAPSLFHFLYNSFKMALGSDRLDQERRILRQAAQGNSHIASFVLEVMLPVVICASAKVPQCWALLEVYADVLNEVFDGGDVVRTLRLGSDGENGGDLERAVSLMREILAWFAALNQDTGLTLVKLHVMTLLVGVASVLRPSLMTYVLNCRARLDDSDGEDDGEPVNEDIPSLRSTLDQAETFFGNLRRRLEEILSPSSTSTNENDAIQDADPPSVDEDTSTGPLGVHVLLRDLTAAGYDTASSTSPARMNPRIPSFADTVIQDVKNNWVVSADRVMVRMATGRGSGIGAGPGGSAGGVGAGVFGTQSLHGVNYVPWTKEELLWRLLGELASGGWETVKRPAAGRGRREKRTIELGELLF